MADEAVRKILEIQVDYGDALTKIAQYKVEIDKIKEQQKEYKKQLKDGEITQQEYHVAMEKSRQTISRLNTESGVYQKQIANQIKAQREQEGSLMQLRAKLSDLTAEYDRLSKADREGDVGAQLKAQINAVTDELKANEEATQRFFRNVGNYKSAFANAGHSADALINALEKECKTAHEAIKANDILQEALDGIDPSAEGADEAIDKINKKLKENEKIIDEYDEKCEGLVDQLSQLTGINFGFADSLSSLSKNQGASFIDGLNVKVRALWATFTGMLANPYILALLGLAGTIAAAKWLYDYNKGLVEASRLTQEFTGLTGDAMKSMRTEVQGVAEAYGKDFQEVLEATNAVAQQFGISHQEAMELVKEGFAAGADANGQFMDILKEYPAYFKEAGLSASEFMAITTQTSKMGIVSDKAVDVIKEANLKLREMADGTKQSLQNIGLDANKIQQELANGSTTTFEVMKQVSEKMSEFEESSPLVGEAITNIFGGPGEDAGIKYITTLKDISTNMDEVTKQAGPLAEIQKQQMESQIELDKTLAAVFDHTGGTFEQMTATAKTWVNNGIVSMIKGCVDLCNWFIDLYNNSMVVRAGVAHIGVQFKIIWSVIKNVCIAIADEIMGLGQIIKGVLTLKWEDVSAGWEKFRKASGKAVASIVKDTVAAYGDAIDETINGQLDHISLDLSKYSVEAPPSTNDSGTDPKKKAGNKVDPKAAENAKKEAEKAKKEQEEQYKLEQEMLRKAQDELLKITEEALETRRLRISISYDRQISDYRHKLETETKLTETAKKAILSVIESLEIQKTEALKKFDAEELKRTIEQQEKLLSLKLESVKKQTDEEYNLRIQQLKNQEQIAILQAELDFKNEEEKQAAIQAIKARYAKENAALEDERNQRDLERKKAALQAEIDSMQLAEDERQLRVRNGYEMTEEYYLQYRERGLAEMEEHQRNILLKQEEAAAAELAALQARGQLSTQTTEEYEAEILAAKQKSMQAQKATNDAIVANEQAKAQAMKAVTAGLTQLLDSLGESNAAFAKMSKVITLAQIAIDTGKALASGIASASGVPFPGNIAAIATTVGTVLANVATAISTVKSAKFAQGGKVTGPGTGTSDSIPAMLSNGEYVMTARATKIFEPLLMAMNNIGSGVPMQVMNSYREYEDAGSLTESFASAVQEIRPVVSVVEITEAQDRVSMIESLDTF